MIPHNILSTVSEGLSSMEISVFNCTAIMLYFPVSEGLSSMEIQV